MLNNKGFSFLEVIIAIGILAIILMVVTPSLSGFRNQQVLVNTSEEISVFLNKARTQTLSSKNSSNYGIHFELDQMVLFTGSTYSESADDNEIISFPDQVIISDINLNGGGSDVTFTRLIGETTQHGTITLELSSDSSRQKIITISQTGIVSIN